MQLATKEKTPHSLSLWPRWLAELPVSVFSRDNRTLVLWHPEDSREALRAHKVRLLAVPDVL